MHDVCAGVKYDGRASVTMQADLANSFDEMKMKMRGDELVEYELVACTTRGKVRGWGGLRVAALCIGVDKYEHMSDLNNAVHDAESIHQKLKSIPNCNSMLLPSHKTSTAGALLAAVSSFLKDSELQNDPPKVLKFFYAGHGIQEGDKTFLVPGRAVVQAGFVDDCLPLDRLAKVFRDTLDLPARESGKHPTGYLFALDCCRDSFPRHLGGGAEKLEPAKGSAPNNYRIVYSCSRATTASDGPSGGNSPFATALVDDRDGFFAENVTLRDAIFNVSRKLRDNYQHVVTAGQEDAFPKDFCINVNVQANNAACAQQTPPLEPSPSGKRKRDQDEEFLSLLRQHGLDDIEQQLKDHDLKSMQKLEAMARLSTAKKNKIIKSWGLSALNEESVKELLKDVATQKQPKVGGGSAAKGGSGKSTAEAEFERSIASLQLQKDVAAIVRGMKMHTTHPGIQKKCIRPYAFSQPSG